MPVLEDRNVMGCVFRFFGELFLRQALRLSSFAQRDPKRPDNPLVLGSHAASVGGTSMGDHTIYCMPPAGPSDPSGV